MKIETANTIRISGKSGAADQLRGIQKGAELPARIIERISGREAILEIGGKRIQAEFQKGIPAGTMLTLKLDDVKDNALLFRMIDPGGREALARRLMETTIADMGQIQKNMGGALSRHPAGILELNALLLGLTPKQEKREEGLTRLLGLLLKLGVDKNAVTDLSLLLSGAPLGAKAFQSLLLMLGFDRERIKKWASGKSGDYEAMISGIISEIARLEEGETREAVISQLIEYASGAGKTEAGYITGEIPFRDHDDMRPVRYMGKDDAWIFSVDFSAMGRVEVLARRSGEEYLISVFCGTREALDAVRESSGELVKNLRNISQGIHVNFHNTEQALNKIVEIYSYFSLNSVFDIRV